MLSCETGWRARVPVRGLQGLDERGVVHQQMLVGHRYAEFFRGDGSGNGLDNGGHSETSMRVLITA